MSGLKNEIADFLQDAGFTTAFQKINGIDLINVACNGRIRSIIPICPTAGSADEAIHQQAGHLKVIDIVKKDMNYPLIVSEDRWRRQCGAIKERLLAHLEIFFPIYARNCEIRRIEKDEAAGFLKENHSYADAACRYRYGMFIKRHTGHILRERDICLEPGTLVAVATFSNARRWIKGDKVIKSYEWTRYASLTGTRICGGMGKMLETFIKEVEPDDIMTYADLEWSEGGAYEQLGFKLEGQKEAVTFIIDPHTWERRPVKQGDNQEAGLYYCNFGSNKYRLKLTDYD